MTQATLDRPLAAVAAEPPRTAASIDPATARALDAVRAAAAGYVALHHVAAARGWLGGAGVVLRFGQEAVIVFFLLSGFVIFASERDRALRPRGYYSRRLRRIYPVLLLALLVSTLVALDNGDLAARFDPRSLAATLIGVQDVAALKPGVVADPYLDNFPLWSLSYEVAFYLVFPLALAFWTRAPRIATHVIGAGCCACYAAFALRPDHATLVGAYFLVWWSGAMAAEASLAGRRGIAAIVPSLAWLAVLVLVAGAVVTIEGSRGPGVYPVLPLRHFAIAALLLIVGASALGRAAAGIASHAGALAAAGASISYALYVFHYPLLVQWKRADGTAGLIGALAATLLLSWFAERRMMRWLPPAPKD